VDSGTISSVSTKTNSPIPLTPGSHTFKLVLDPNNEIDEPNELNNEKTISFISEDCSDLKQEIQPKFQIKTAQNNLGVPGTWTPWQGYDCTSGSYYTSSGQQICQLNNNNSFIQYRLLLDDIPDVVPAIGKVDITYTGKKNIGPLVNIKASPQEVFLISAETDEIEFTARAVDIDGELISYRWDLGDGTTAELTTNKINHSYANFGTYNVNVTIMDDDGAVQTAKTKVYVSSYNCLQDSPIKRTGPVQVYNVVDLPESVKSDIISDILSSYATKKNIAISEIDTTAEHYEAVAFYLIDKMTYHFDSTLDQALCGRNFGGASMGDIIRNGLGANSCNMRRCNNFLCGTCADFSMMFTALSRLIGISEKCVFSGWAPGHGYNVINVNGRFRIYEPQSGSIESNFYSDSAGWTCCGPSANNIKTCTVDWPCYAPYHVFNDAYGNWNGMDLPSNSYLLTSNYLDTSGNPDPNNRCIDYTPNHPGVTGDPQTYKGRGLIGDTAGWNTWALNGSLTYYEDRCP
ncbi:MAG: PKD domain-containing protein, partial [Nanoarchaeota archaeon]